MEIIKIPIDLLHAHPLNSNVMDEKSLHKLAAHLDRTDRYPPVIVRAVPVHDELTGYQILDGHHRIKALQMIGRSEARCLVWEVDDDEALLLLATLNRLRGDDHLRKRAQLVDELSRHFDLKSLANQLPENVSQLEKLLAVHESPPTPRIPISLDDIPVAVHFFLLPHQKNHLDRCLSAIGGLREEALMRLVESWPH